jgi:hypothetical protein
MEAVHLGETFWVIKRPSNERIYPQFTITAVNDLLIFDV